MIEAVMVVLGFVTSPVATMQREAVYSQTMYESFEVCQGSLKPRAEEIAKFLMREEQPVLRLSIDENTMEVYSRTSPSLVTLTCKEL